MIGRSGRTGVRLAKVKRVRKIGIADTYNMEVKDHLNFSVNGGLIVHNCGYGIVSYHMNKSRPLIMPKVSSLPWALRTDEDIFIESTDPYATW